MNDEVFTVLYCTTLHYYLGLERLCGDVVSGMLQAIEDKTTAMNRVLGKDSSSDGTTFRKSRRVSPTNKNEAPLSDTCTSNSTSTKYLFDNDIVNALIDQLQMVLVTQYFPNFADLYSQLYTADAAYAVK